LLLLNSITAFNQVVHWQGSHLQQGEVEVVFGDRVVSTLGEGSFFGEIALLFESKRTASIRAKTYCDLYVLRKTGTMRLECHQHTQIVAMFNFLEFGWLRLSNTILELDRALKSFPEQRSIIKQIAGTANLSHWAFIPLHPNPTYRKSYGSGYSPWLITQ
jgi:hypothetical protein